MVVVKKKTVGCQNYYYLEHSIREGKKVQKKEKYLGKKLPKNIEKIKEAFIREIYEEKWFSQFDIVKKNFLKARKSMPKSMKEKELKNFSIKFTYDTQRIEGSTLTLRETADLLQKGISPKCKPVRDIKEAEAHQKVFFEMMKYKKNLNLSVVLLWHKKLLEQTDYTLAGYVRRHQVAIAGSQYVPPAPFELGVLLSDFFKWYNKNKEKLHPIELAALVHLRFVLIHPLADGNGRISRLMMNFVLKQFGYPMFDIPYAHRNSYYNALERTSMKEDERIFLHWFFRAYLKIHKKFLYFS